MTLLSRYLFKGFPGRGNRRLIRPEDLEVLVDKHNICAYGVEDDIFLRVDFKEFPFNALLV